MDSELMAGRIRERLDRDVRKDFADLLEWLVFAVGRVTSTILE